jgi:hypothetical protein
MARLPVEAGVAGTGCLRRHLYGGLHHLQVLPEPSSLHRFSKLLNVLKRSSFLDEGSPWGRVSGASLNSWLAGATSSTQVSFQTMFNTGNPSASTVLHGPYRTYNQI